VLREHVAKHFQRITYGTFWTASRAASLRAGDCTEHAVVVAALARARGLPARVALGYVMLTDGKRGLALGHAWTEVHDGTRWHAIDATPVGAEKLAYLVLAELEDETPSFNLALLDSMAILSAATIEVERATP
jgi:transglutaminase-like putative cysteine protease